MLDEIDRRKKNQNGVLAARHPFFGREKMMIRLTAFEISGLFGLYDYSFLFNLDNGITALIGRNGRGKTACLRFIDAFFHQDVRYLRSLFFHRATLKFSNHQEVNIFSKNFGNSEFEPRPNAPEQKMHMEISISGKNSKPWEIEAIDFSNPILHRISRSLPFLERSAPDLWIDERSGETLTSARIFNEYQHRLSGEVLQAIDPRTPPEFKSLIDAIDCRLIDTQRLSSKEFDLDDIRRRRLFGLRGYDEFEVKESEGPRSAIHDKAAKLKEIIEASLTEYATVSQNLDRSFPERVIRRYQDPNDKPSTIQDDLVEKLDTLEKRRQELVDAGIFADVERFIPKIKMDSQIKLLEVANFLEVYVDDTEKKLRQFDSLYEKISIFRKLVSNRIIDKRFVIDRKTGFSFLSNSKESHISGKPIRLEHLSSGEQHQVVLFFNLLFGVDEQDRRTLILIDEPELSLHISWLNEFIDGLMEILKGATIDVIIATHSPDLLANHMDLAISLDESAENMGEVSYD